MTPDLAEQARTAVALAEVGTLTTYSRRAPARSRTTVVRLQDDAAGLRVELEPDCPATRDLLERPLATVRVGPPTCTTVLVHGGVQRVRGTRRPGRLCFRIEPAVVRAGEPSLEPVDLLDHLRRRHGAQLAAQLRRRGHSQAGWVEPRSLDRHGLVLTVLALDGGETVRLDFASPVRSVAELAPRLRGLLWCSGGCWCCDDAGAREAAG